MNDLETFELLKELIDMPEDNFKKCVEFAENMEASENVKNFIMILINLASTKRTEKIQRFTSVPKLLPLIM